MYNYKSKYRQWWCFPSTKWWMVLGWSSKHIQDFFMDSPAIKKQETETRRFHLYQTNGGSESRWCPGPLREAQIAGPTAQPVRFLRTCQSLAIGLPDQKHRLPTNSVIRPGWSAPKMPEAKRKHANVLIGVTHHHNSLLFSFWMVKWILTRFFGSPKSKQISHHSFDTLHSTCFTHGWKRRWQSLEIKKAA